MQDHPASPLELIVVMPVYNEEKAIPGVIAQWCAALDACGMHYSILAVDDGSRDGTAAVLQTLQEQSGGKLEVVHQKNAGHGQAILTGYRLAVQRQVPWIFQIDSDGQCDPQFFPGLWAARDGYDFITGYRKQRDDGISRKVISLVLRGVVWIISGVNCRDANVPYRLMRTEAVAPIIRRIPTTCFFTNVGLSVLSLKAGLRYRYLPIIFRARAAGETTVPLSKLGKNALTLCQNLQELLKT